MAILRLNKSLLCLGALAFAAGCRASSTCADFDGAFVIEGWDSQLPSSVKVYSYEAGSGFSKATGEPIAYESHAGKNPKGRPFLRVNAKDPAHASLPVNADYKLVIDDVLEYRITKLVPGPGNRGCPLESGMVNGCSIEADRLVEFDKSCK